jgi:hypothetical protein
VLLAHRGQAVGLVAHRVVLRADAEEAAVQQPDGAGQHPLARQPVRRGEVGGDPLAQRRQRPGEGDHLVELLLVAAPAPVVVVAVLLAARLVRADRLQVAVGVRADPDVVPRGRDHELGDALEHLGLVDAAAVLVDVEEAAPVAPPADAGAGAVGAAQTGHGPQGCPAAVRR